MIRAWGLDPGFANLGVAVCEIHAEQGELARWCNPVELAVFQTEASAKKRKVLAGDDNFRRAQQIARFLGNLPAPDIICAEAMSFTPHASSSSKLAMTWGVIAGYAEENGIAVLQVSPKQIKEALGVELTKGRGRGLEKKADKSAVAKALHRIYVPAVLFHLLEQVAPSMQDHPLDALGAVLACRDSTEMRMLYRVITGSRAS